MFASFRNITSLARDVCTLRNALFNAMYFITASTRFEFYIVCAKSRYEKLKLSMRRIARATTSYRYRPKIWNGPRTLINPLKGRQDDGMVRSPLVFLIIRINLGLPNNEIL